ncbi:MAG: T9SS C-terminal target domain-containing protein [Cytophagales bacterium]|nr:MAG: T9SS C-terminal target domain-containing protein [Cytophagales bacterium]
MKATRPIWLPALLLGLALTPALAQQRAKEKGDVTIKIIERNGDNVRETTRTYRLDSDDDRDKIAMKLVDSLKAAHPGDRKRQMTIIIDEGDGTRVREQLGDNSSRSRSRSYSGPDWQYDFRVGVDSVVGQVDRFFRHDFEPGLNRAFEGWSRNYNGKTKSSTIRSLEVFPNNPDRDGLNIRFTAPAKGDVEIVVTTPKGNQVGRKTVKDFSGEFVGQVDLDKKAPSGVYFVTVTQNDDGAVKRIVVE